MAKKKARAAMIDALINQGGFSIPFSPNTNTASDNAKPLPKNESNSVDDQAAPPTTAPHPSLFAQTDSVEKETPPPPNSSSARSGTTTVETDRATDHYAGVVLQRAEDHRSIGKYQKKYAGLYVIDTKSQLQRMDFRQKQIVFINPALVEVWGYHDRASLGKPQLEDILDSIETEGQFTPCELRLSKNHTSVVLHSGFRRYSAIKQLSGMYLLGCISDGNALTDTDAWLEMFIENDADQKSPIPFSVKVESIEQAIAVGLFKNKKQLSEKLGKDRRWANDLFKVYNQVPETIRKAAGPKLIATLQQRDFNEIGRLLKDGSQGWLQDRVDKVLEHQTELFAEATSFPVKKIRRLFVNYDASTVKKYSTQHARFSHDSKGHLKISITKELSLETLDKLQSAISDIIQSKEQET